MSKNGRTIRCGIWFLASIAFLLQQCPIVALAQGAASAELSESDQFASIESSIEQFSQDGGVPPLALDDSEVREDLDRESEADDADAPDAESEVVPQIDPYSSSLEDDEEAWLDSYRSAPGRFRAGSG